MSDIHLKGKSRDRDRGVTLVSVFLLMIVFNSLRNYYYGIR